MGYYLGIDLGTTYTAAAAERVGVVEAVTLGNRTVSVPSVVFLRDDGEILVGEPATRRAMTDPSRVAREFKRRVGDPTPIILGGSPYSAELLMARLLRWSVDRVHEQHGEPPQAIALTHPANWGHYKTDLFTQAVRQVDLDAALLLPEPVAAATFYASQRRLAPGSVVAVYDLGGGTFDAALVRRDTHGFEIIGTPEGIDRLGGIDFDEAVFSHVRNALGNNLDRLDPDDPATRAAVARLRQDCIDAKEALSSDTDVSIPVLLPNLQTEIRLNRSEFETMITPAITETIVALRRAIRSAQMSAHDIDAVLLVGGSSRIPLVAQMVATALDRPIAIDANPKDAIAFGAAITLAQHHGTATPETVTTHIPNPHPTTPTHPQPNRPRQHQPTQSAPPRQRRSSPAAPSRQRPTTKPNSSPRQQPRTNRRRTPPTRGHSPISMILGGGLATLLLTTTAISTRQAIQASHDTQHTHDQTTLATASIGPTSLMSRLQNERNAAAIYMLGQEDQFTLQHEDPVEAARITDEAVATFRAEVERQGDAVVDAYSPAFEAMEGLEDLRAEAAATPEASRTLVNIDATAANFDAYSEIRAAMVDANRRVALSLDDPQLRQGVQLVELNGLQANLVAVLVRDLLLAQVGGTDPNGLDTPEEISGVARRLSEVRHNWDLMVSGGSGRYGPLVEELLAAEEVQRFPEVVEESLQTGEVNVADVITYSFGDDPETLAYTVFAERVDHIVRERSRGLEAAVARRQRLSSVLAGAAAALALVVIFTLVVVTRRRRERLQRETAAPTHDEVQIARVS